MIRNLAEVAFATLGWLVENIALVAAFMFLVPPLAVVLWLWSSL